MSKLSKEKFEAVKKEYIEILNVKVSCPLKGDKIIVGFDEELSHRFEDIKTNNENLNQIVEDLDIEWDEYFLEQIWGDENLSKMVARANIIRENWDLIEFFSAFDKEEILTATYEEYLRQ